MGIAISKMLPYKFNTPRTGHHVERSKAEALRGKLEKALEELRGIFKWNIVFIDDQIKGKEKAYYDAVKATLKEILGDEFFREERKEEREFES